MYTSTQVYHFSIYFHQIPNDAALSTRICILTPADALLNLRAQEEFDFVGYFFPHIYDKMLMLCTYRYYEIMEFMSQVDSQTLAMSMNRCAGPTSGQNEDGDSDLDDRKPENTVFGFAIPSVSPVVALACLISGSVFVEHLLVYACIPMMMNTSIKFHTLT